MRSTTRQKLENQSQKCPENSWKFNAVNATEEKVSGVGMKRRTTMTIELQNNETTDANTKTAKLLKFNTTMT